MKVLVIGGSVFVGAHIVRALRERAHDVTILNRGVTPDPHGDGVERLRADRRTPGAMAAALGSATFDAAVDVSCYTGDDAREAVAALAGRAGRLVMISTGQVYLVREGCTTPSAEADYAGPIMARPATRQDADAWAYGVGKREAEDVLEAAHREGTIPVTRLRLPIIHGEGDPRHRLTSYIARLLDGGPLLLPEGGGQPVRHVDVLDVATFVVHLAGTGAGAGEAFNLAWEPTLTLRELVEALAATLGVRARLCPAPLAMLERSGLLPFASPLGDRWSSVLDPSRAKTLLGAVTRRPEETFARIVAAWRSRSLAPPAGLAQRGQELECIRALGGAA